jgi:WD40 repeat protein
MRLLPVLLLMFSSLVWGGVVPKKTSDEDSSIVVGKTAIFYWTMSLKTAPNLVLSAAGDGTAVLRDVQSGKTLHTWRHDDWVRSVAFSPDGRQVLTGSDDKTVVLRDVQSGKTLQTWRHDSAVLSAAFSPDGKQVLTGLYDKTVVLREVQSGKVSRTWRHDDWVCSVAFSPDGKQVLTGSADRTVVLRDVQSGKTLLAREDYGTVCSVSFSPDGKQVLFSAAMTAVLIDLQSKTLQTWRHDNWLWSVAFSPDGKQVLTGSADKTVVLRDVQSGKTLQTWRHDDWVRSVAFSPDGRQVLTGSDDKTVVLRDVQSGKTLYTWGQDSAVLSVAFQRGTLKDLGAALSDEISYSEAEYRSLPRSLADRQSKLDLEKPTKDEFESVAQFNQRVAQRNAAVEKLNVDIQAHYANLGPLPMGKRAQAFQRALFRAYGNPELHDVRYDPETARFFATLKASLNPEFKRLVSIAVPNDQARAAKAKLTSSENNLEVELRVTDKNELIWGQPRLRLDDKIIVADYLDKDFVTPVTTAIVSDPQLKTILPPPIATLPSNPDVKVIDDPNINKLQMEVLQKEREQATLAARQAEEKRLKERLAELNQQTKPEFADDLPNILAKVPASKPNPKVHVLAVGISDYADVPDVPFADRSAQQFAEIAKKLFGAEPQNVIVLTDSQATLGRLLGRLNTLLNRLGPDDQLLFFYAGHGVPAKDGSGAYLLAQDGGPGSYEQLPLQLGHLYKAIAKSKVGQAKIFIDACFSGRSGKDTIVFEGIAPVVPKVDQSFPDSQRLVVVTAGRGDQFSNQDKVRGHRLFSYHLMRLLLEDGPKVEISQLHKRLRDIVLNESRRIGPEFEQEPEFFGNGQLKIFN